MTNEERQQAIEWLKRRPVTMAGAKMMYDLAVEALEAYVPDMNDVNMDPSRESNAEITRCSDDTISRKAAIDALHMHLMYRMGTDSNKKRLDEWINNLPSAQPNHGKWVFKTVFPNDTSEFPMGYLVCSECGSKHPNKTPCNFCDNCGADMRGEQE